MSNTICFAAKNANHKRPVSGYKGTTKSHTVVVNMAGQDTPTCTCGFVETQRLKEDELRQSRLAAKLRAVNTQRERQVL